MSILIKGMEMPQGNSTINVLIYADGTVYTGHVNDSQYSAVSVPTPHGRLGDLDNIYVDGEGYFYYNEHEPCWELKFVGDRFKELLETDVVAVFKMLKAAYDALTEWKEGRETE